MNAESRFDLETAIATWRRFAGSQRAISADDADELESHLRDEIDVLMGQGHRPEVAYREAVRRMGDYATLEQEYRQVYWKKLRAEHHVIDELRWRSAMLKNYLKTALRHLGRHKGYTFINVSGLALGMACCLVIFLFVQDELRYDAHHEKADRIYRVVNTQHSEEGTNQRASTPPAIGPALARAFPEVLQAVRFYPRNATLFSYEDRQFIEPHGFMVDASVFDVFSFSLLKGDPRTALTAPYTIVLTASAARKYFGEQDPLGKTLTLDNVGVFEVTGVMEDLPPHSHLQFSYLGSYATMRDLAAPALEPNNWRWQDFYTYVLLPEGYDAAKLQEKLPAFIAEHADPYTRQAGYHHEPSLQPLQNVYLHSAHLQGDVARKGSLTAVRAFSWIAVLILLIACFNFINLTTARSSGRTKEVGVRKAVGAYRLQLMKQFLSESLLVTFLSLMVALVLTVLILPVFNQLFAKALHLDFGAMPWLLPGLLGTCLAVGLAAGSYPAFLLSTFQPVVVLKGHLATGKHRVPLLRKGLVVVQFAISITLIIATGIVLQQLSYVQHHDMGFNEEQVVILPLRGQQVPTAVESFKAEVLQQPGVRSATAARGIPGGLVSGDWVGFQERELPLLTNILLVDHDYIETFEMEMAAGRNFSRSFPSDAEQAFLLNEAAAHELGWGPEEALGKRAAWTRWGRNAGVQEGTVVGVVKDFNVASFHQKVGPAVMTIYPPAFRHMAVRIHTNDVASTIEALAQTWKAWVPDWPFEYAFLDQQFAALYASERRLSRLILLFSVLAILIAGLGLFGLAAFTAEQRTKEIGIRKVLGARVASITLLLTKDILLLVLLAFFIALPTAYVTMQRWLEDFVYRVDLSGWIFLMAGLAALGIALLTVSYQVIKAALADPVKSLRHE